MQQLYNVQGDEASLRRMQLDSLDASNRALQLQIWTLEDQKKAAEEAAKAKREKCQSLKEAQQFLAGVTNNITQYLDKLNASTPDTNANYRNAQTAFDRELAIIAKGQEAAQMRDDELAAFIPEYTDADGNPLPTHDISRQIADFNRSIEAAYSGDINLGRDALSGITSYADTLIGTIGEKANSQAEENMMVARVKAQLAQLPKQVSAEQYIVDAIYNLSNDLDSSLSDGLTGLDESVSGGISDLDDTLGTGLEDLRMGSSW